MKALGILAPALAVLGAALAPSGCTSSSSSPGAGAPCSSDNDCPSDAFCTWPTTNACGQKGTCIVPPSDQSTCAPGPRVCPCDDSAMQLATCYGVGVPVKGSLGCLHSPCTPGATACNAGLVCLVSECVPPVEAGAGSDAGTGVDSAPPADAASDATTD